LKNIGHDRGNTSALYQSFFPFLSNLLPFSAMRFSSKAIFGKEPRVSITFAPDRPSADEFQQFLAETDYQHSPTKPLPSPPRPDVPDFICGYVSPIQLKYFIWEAGSFKEGSLVMLGSSTCVARVTKAQRVGRNYF
jgi:hypothetical protein